MKVFKEAKPHIFNWVFATGKNTFFWLAWQKLRLVAKKHKLGHTEYGLHVRSQHDTSIVHTLGEWELVAALCNVVVESHEPAERLVAGFARGARSRRFEREFGLTLLLLQTTWARRSSQVKKSSQVHTVLYWRGVQPVTSNVTCGRLACHSLEFKIHNRNRLGWEFVLGLYWMQYYKAKKSSYENKYVIKFFKLNL